MNTDTLRLGFLGMIPGNGHPYSWAAIINGYDPVEMAKCPYPAISAYLSAQPFASVRIPGACVTHIWTDDPKDAEKVAHASKIPHIVHRMEEMIGHVDAVMITTDDGADHVRRARPFIEAGLPAVIDKPLATTRAELAQFIAWEKTGARILSSSGLRYAPELHGFFGKKWCWLTGSTCKTWENYGIHVLEPIYKILGPGFQDVRAESREGSDIVYLCHRSGTQVTISAIYDAAGSFGVIHGYGHTEHYSVQMKDTYTTFRAQMLSVIDWLRTGEEPYPFEETIELMAILIAAIESRAEGRLVSVERVITEMSVT